MKKKVVVKGENVLGYIQGTDLKNELIVISAHYDHLGKKDSLIFNGADDNASGTGKPGQKMAADYIKSYFKSIGNRRKKKYYQKFKIRSDR